MDTSQAQGQDQNAAQPGSNQDSDLGDAKASLAFSNMLREGIFNMQNPPMVGGTAQPGQSSGQQQGSQPGQSQPGQQPGQQGQPDMQKELDSFKKEIMKEVQGTIKKEIGGMQKEIQSVIDEESKEGDKPEVESASEETTDKSENDGESK